MTTTALLIQDREEQVLPLSTPHLSHSRINRYLTCPEQYRLYYVVGLRPIAPAASLVFGQFLHQALAHLFQHHGDPVGFFRELWGQIKDAQIAYSARETWETLGERGAHLLQLFVETQLPQMGEVEASEKPFRLSITGLNLPFVGIIDLLARVSEKKTIVDFKSASASYGEHDVVLNDQLTAYLLAESGADQAALCVFMKTKEHRIDWFFAPRDPQRVSRYLDKVKLIGREIGNHHFYQRPGKWCAWCDYLAVCLGEKEQVAARFMNVH